MESLLSAIGEWMENNPEAIPPEIRAHLVAGREPVLPEPTTVPDDPTGSSPPQNSPSDSDSLHPSWIHASTSPERSSSPEADHLASGQYHKGENIIIVVEILFQAKSNEYKYMHGGCN